MSDLGSLHFQIHLQDMTDADADKIKKKLENLSVSLKIDGNNITVANADAIKKQIEAAVKSVSIPSVSVDANAVKQQVDTAFKAATPQVSVTLLKGNLDKDIQTYLSSKTYDIKISISSQQAQSQIKNLGSVTITAKLKLDKKAAIDALKKSLQNSSVPIGVRMKSAKDLANDIRTKMQNTPIKVNIDANKNILTSNIKQALKNQTFKADLKLNIQKVDVQQAIRDAFAKAGLAYNTTASNVRAALISTRQQKADAYVDAQKALADLRRAQMASAQAAAQHKNAMQGVNDVASKQKSLMTQLAQKIADLYSVVRIGDFVANMVRIGGEFEQQKVALGTIVGDASKAGALFERIKNLAVESPYKFGDLAAYSKQLAAFGIEYNELYDTLKRFGDISAGLGVDMQRIILAFGQVKSAEFLKGTELRQFTEAGIPLVSELARRYTELEGSLVSVGDVFDRISKKEVPFEDVRAVLWDLTNEGGRFYEMQAVLTDTLKGKLDKLVDSYEIFLSKIANSNYSIIGGTLDLLAEILKHWKEIEKAVKVAVSAYGAYKAALISIVALQKIAHNVEAVYRLGRSMIFLGKAVNGVDAVFKMLKATLMRHPIGLIATAVSALVGTLALLSGEERNVAEEVDSLNAKLATELDLIEQQKSKAGDLASIMSGSKNSIQSRNKAYSGLLAIYPNLFVGMSQEQALLLSELDIRERIAEAAKKEAREKLQADLAVNRNKLSGLQTELEGFKIQKNWRISKGYGKDNAEKWFNEATKKLRGDIALVETAINNTEIDLLKLDQVASDAAARKGERWYKDAEKYVDSLGEKFKDLKPKDSENRDSYFSRIGNAVSSLKNKIGELNPELESAKELLDGENGLNVKYKVTKHIYTKILGGKDEDFDKLLKERQDLEKKREKETKDAAKRAVGAYIEALKNEVSQVGERWNLFKELVDTTGDKGLAMKIAFDGQAVSFESELEWLKHRIKEEAKKANLNMSITDLLGLGEKQLIDKGVEEKIAKSLGHLIDTYNKSNKKLSVDTIKEYAEIIKASRNFEEQIAAIDAELQEDLANLRTIYKDDPTALNFAEVEAKRRADEQKSNLRFEQFKKETDWVQIFDDLDRVSGDVIYGMIDKIEEFSKSTNLSQDEVKQLMEALGKLREKTFEFNPFGSLADAIKRLRELQSMQKKVNRYGVTLYDRGSGYGENRYISETEYQNALKSAESDIVKSIGGISDKFNDLKNVLDPLVDMFGGADTVFGKIIGGLSNAFNGAVGMGNSVNSLANLKFGGKDLGTILGLGGNAGFWGAVAGAGISITTALLDAFGADYSSYNKMKEEYDNLLGVWDALIERKREYVDIDYADEARKAGQEALDIIEKQIDAYRTLGKERLNAGAGIGSHSIGMRIKKYMSEEGWGQYQAAMKEMGLDADWVAKGRMELLFEMSAEQLAQLQEKAPVFWAKLDEDVREYLENIIASNEALEEMRETLNETMTGVSLDAFYDNYISMLTDLDKSNQDFAQSFEEYMKNAIIANLMGSKYRAEIENIYKQWAGYSDTNKDGAYDLTPDEADALKNAYNGLTNQMIEDRDNLAELFGWDDLKSSADGLSKGVQSVTEDTANLLGSYLNSIRGDVYVQRTLIEQLVNVSVPRMSVLAEAQLRELNQIVANTKRNADAADSIREALSSVIGIGKNGKAIKIV